MLLRFWIASPIDSRPVARETPLEMDMRRAISGISIVLMLEGIWVGIVEGVEFFVEIDDVPIGPF